MHTGDLDEVLAIERTAFERPWTREMFESELKNPVSHAYVLWGSYQGGRIIVAYIIFWVIHGEAHILDLAVDERLRRTGIGEMILRAALDKMYDNLVYEVYLEVRKSNEAALSLYRKLGFKDAFERKNYYGDEDAIVMTKVFN